MSLSDLEDEVHVWFCCSAEPSDNLRLEEYRSILSAEENARQRGFYSEKDQHSYLLSHVLVRKTLSEYCDITPEQWQFTPNAHGKPEIAAELDGPPLRFNLSHTDGLSACVVSLHDDCGIDVENILRQNKLLSIARRMFAEPELETMRDLSDGEMRNRFFDYWTLREAYVKALGTGLKESSRQFYFEIAKQQGAERTAEIYSSEKNEYLNNEWQFTLLKPTAEHTAAIAVHLSGALVKKIVCRQLLL